MDTSFLYKSLPLTPDSKCIRVLDVAAPSHQQAPLTGNLRVVNLDDQPSFTALSYCWGVPASAMPCSITCGVFDIPLMPSAHSALSHLRQKIGAFTIWVDALCIDQDNEVEKSYQIPLMGRIYSQASSVYVWIGDGNAGTDRAIAYLAEAGFRSYYVERRPIAAAFSAFLERYSLASHPFPVSGNTKSWSPPYAPIFFWTKYKTTSLYATFEDINDILSREWITRLWTYQEILLANNPIIVCGDAHVSWDYFDISMVFLGGLNDQNLTKKTRPWKAVAFQRERWKLGEAPTSYHPVTSRLESYSKFIERVKATYIVMESIKLLVLSLASLSGFIFMIFGTQKTETDGRRLVIVGAIFFGFILIIGIDTARSRLLGSPFHAKKPQITNQKFTDDFIHGLYARRATKPEDMAFGAWGVLEKYHKSRLPEPDHSRDIGAVYQVFTVHLLKATTSLELLILAASARLQNRPSWVPDWSAGGSQPFGSFEKFLNTQDHRVVLRSHVESSSPYHYFRDATYSVLTVRAREFGAVGNVRGFQITQDEFDDREIGAHLENIRLVQSFSQRTYQKSAASKNPPQGIPWSSLPAWIFNIFAIDTDSNDIGLSSSQLRSWASFCFESRAEPPSKVLTLLRQRQHTSGTITSRIWKAHQNYSRSNSHTSDIDTFQLRNARRTHLHDLFRIHITVCNFLARSGKVLFEATLHSGSNSVWAGLSSSEACLGDKVVGVSGVPLLLLVRRYGVGVRNVRLISPAILWNHKLDIPSTAGTSLFRPYEEIFIH